MARRLAVSVLALVFWTLALGSESKLRPPELDQYLRWGALRVRPGLALSNVGYDNNILYNDANKVSDYTATISPKAEVLILFGDRAFLQLNQRFDFTLYLENTDQNYDNNHTAARVTVPLGPIVKRSCTRPNRLSASARATFSSGSCSSSATASSALSLDRLMLPNLNSRSDSRQRNDAASRG